MFYNNIQQQECYEDCSEQTQISPGMYRNTLMDNENTEAAISAGVQLLCTNSTARVNATSSSIQCLGVVFADTAAQSCVLCESVLRLHFDQLLDTVHVQTPLFQLLLHRGNLEQLETSLVNYYNMTSSVYPEY